VNHASDSARIRNHPRYQELVTGQRTFIAGLTAVTLIPYFTFILIAAFAPQLLASKLSANSAITLGWPLGVAFIVGAWLLTGVYILRANRRFDALTTQIREEVIV